MLRNELKIIRAAKDIESHKRVQKYSNNFKTIRKYDETMDECTREFERIEKSKHTKTGDSQ